MLQAWLESAWYDASGRRGAGLRPLGALFGGVVALRRAAYRRGWLRSARAALPVVVVGNLSVGGTGKTPFCSWLAAELRARGVVPGLLSRGYGGQQRGARARDVRPGDDPAEVGDEPLLLAAAGDWPVVVAAERLAGAARLRERGAQLVICDDGLQHYALQRDLEIAVVDAARGLGNGRLLPAGPLREPATRLAEVDFVVRNGEGGWHPGDAVASGALFKMQLQPAPLRRIDGAAAGRPLDSFRGMPLHAVAAIGNPARFFATLRAAGLEPQEHAFPDHHAFSVGDLAFGDDWPVLMTSKDAVKCRTFADPRLWELPVGARLEPDAGRAIIDRVVSLIHARR
ncbi:MAG: tetraacyldisaccharide 4'-kinase [Steroidobacteraceae bacterium]